MVENLVTTAEKELKDMIDWLGEDEIVPSSELCRYRDLVLNYLRGRLQRIETSHDGWRSRCLAAEKKNGDLIDELRLLREELRDVKYGEPARGNV